MIVILQSRSTLTIPREIRERLRLEPGAPLEAAIEQGRLVLTPVATVPRLARLSPSGEAKEAAADEDVARGRVERYASAEALLGELES